MQEPTESLNPPNELNPALEPHLASISKWAKFISIIGFSLGAFIVMVMLVSGREVLNMMAAALPIQVEGLYGALIFAFFIIFFIAAAVLYFLFKSSQLLKQGVQQKNTVLIAEGFVFLKRFFLVIALLGIIGLFSNVMKLFM